MKSMRKKYLMIKEVKVFNFLLTSFQRKKKMNVMMRVLQTDEQVVIGNSMLCVPCIATLLFLICVWKRRLFTILFFSLLGAILAVGSFWFLDQETISNETFNLILNLSLFICVVLTLLMPSAKSPLGLLVATNIFSTNILLFLFASIVNLPAINLDFGDDSKIYLMLAITINLLGSIAFQYFFIRQYLKLKFKPGAN